MKLLPSVGNRFLEPHTEAVGHYRELAAANPAAYLPDLATSLNNLSDRLDHSDQVSAAWQAAIDALVHPAARAELRAAWAHWLSTFDQLNRAGEQLRQAATGADAPSPDEQPPDRMSIILAVRARQAVRTLA
jgi:hypothetical protein